MNSRVGVEYDGTANAIYIDFSEDSEARSTRQERLDDRRILEWDDHGNILGVEFLDVSGGIVLDGVPRADDIRAALAALGHLVSA